MRLIESLEDFSPLKDSIALTIGVFDGCHLGHQSVFKRLRRHDAESVVLTFANHPFTVLRPGDSIPLIYSKDQKLKLLREVDTVLSIPFTRELANLSCESFLEKLHRHCPFTHLVLGHDATFGKNREGSRDIVQEKGKNLRFGVSYLPAVRLSGTVVSSTAIRQYILSGNLDDAARFLGRPYSISGTVQHGRGQGKVMGFPTANLSLDGLCLPPFGVYRVDVLHQGQSFKGVANLGLAPTIGSNHKPLLETLIIDFDKNLYGQSIEVLFKQYLRPEKTFDSLDQLKEQIQADLLAAT